MTIMSMGGGGSGRPKPGDHIFTWRLFGTYAHHGIYVGDNQVIHLTTAPPGNRQSGLFSLFSISSSSQFDVPCRKCGTPYKRSGILSSCLDCFLENGDWHRYQYNGGPVARFLLLPVSSYPESDDETVVRRAKSALNDEPSFFQYYNVALNNCIHFAVYCKTGVWELGLRVI